MKNRLISRLGTADNLRPVAGSMDGQQQSSGGFDPQLQQFMTALFGQLEGKLIQLAESQAQQKEAHEAQIRVLQDTIARLDPTQPEARETLNPNMAEIAASTPIVTPPIAETERRTRPALPDPPKFDGRRHKFRAWLLEMKNKLRTDGRTIGDNTDQFSYIFARLDSKPQQLCATYVQQKGSEQTATQFLAYLESYYGDPNLEERAVDQIKTLVQGKNQPFAKFYPEFEVVMANAGGAEWTDNVKRATLKMALNEDLRRAVAGQIAMPEDYQEYVKTIRKLSSQLETLAKNRPPINRQSSPPPRRVTKPAAEEMDWEPIRASSAKRMENYQRSDQAPPR